jgi:alpha-1,3-rhamnosyltransferase
MGIETLVSVIIPAYNHAGFIESCIESVAGQSFQNLELIIINDGSTDKTNEKIVELLPRYKERFVEVTYINRGNKGIGSTLNELISNAKGEYIFQIASDDKAKPEAVEQLLDFLEENPDYGLAVGDNEIIDAGDNRVYWDNKRRNSRSPKDIKNRTFGEYLKYRRPDVDFNSSHFGELSTLLIGNYIPNGKMFRKSALIEAGGYIEGVVEDYYINIMLAKKFKFKYIDQVFLSYRWHETNTIKNTVYMQKRRNNMKELLKKERMDAKKNGIMKTPFCFSVIKILYGRFVARNKKR